MQLILGANMVKICDIMYALAFEFDKLCPDVRSLLDDEEMDGSDIFYHYINISTHTRKNFFSKTVVVDIQTIYSANIEDKSLSRQEKNYRTYDELQQFLSNGDLKVKNRTLGFKHSTKNVDGMLGIAITFTYMDDVICPEWNKEQARELMKQIYVTKEIKE